MGDRVLLRTAGLPRAADGGALRPRRDGPFTVTAGRSPYACTLALPREMRGAAGGGPTVSADRLEPFSARAGAAPAPGPAFDARQEGEREAASRQSLHSTAGWRLA